MIRLLRAGHVAAGLTPHRLGVVLVLDAQLFAQRRVLKGSHIARRIDVRMSRPELLIDDDSVVDRKSRLLGESDVWFDADAGDNAIHLSRPLATIFPPCRDN